MTPRTPRILVVDDDAGQRGLLAAFLSRQRCEVTAAESGNRALDVVGSQAVDLVISDVRMSGLSGIEFMREARRRGFAAPFIFVTAYADVRDAVGAMRDGAVNYLEKPIDLDELRDCVNQALGLRLGAPREGEPLPPLPDDVIALSRGMQQTLREAHLVAQTDSRVLISGESGTGKEVVAELIHAWSKRAAKPVTKVNCAAIPANLLESELFGHEKGAFTGAVKQRTGRFEDADGGTLFLDEIGEMSAPLQAKLLRVIQDGTFERLGSNDSQHADVRIIAATNRDLEREVRDGRFREDLFYRLNVMELYLLPLRERPEDILPLAELFAARFAKGRARFSGGVAAILAIYPWPGNVRELRNAMERATLLAAGRTIMPEHLPRRLVEATAIPEATVVEDESDEGKIKQMERALILQTLAEHDYNRTETAQVLGISRRSLIYKLRSFEDQGYRTSG